VPHPVLCKHVRSLATSLLTTSSARLQSQTLKVVNPLWQQLLLGSFQVRGWLERYRHARHYSKPAKLKSVITQTKIQEAIQILAETAKPKRIILFGSYATGQAHEGSDLDFLVIKETIKDYDEEIVDLELALLPLGISKDILLASTKGVNEWVIW
jgi:uncharacterized protein